MREDPISALGLDDYRQGLRLLALPVAASVGAVAVFAPMIGAALAGVLLLTSLLTVTGSVPLSVLVMSSTVDLLGGFGGGSVSVMGLLSIGYALGSWFLWLLRPTAMPAVAVASVPLTLFVVWGMIGFVLVPSNDEGVSAKYASQNLIVILSFIGLMLLSARTSSESASALSSVGRTLVWGTWAAAALYLFVRFLPEAKFGLRLGPRSFALFALIGLAWHLAGWRYGSRANVMAACLVMAVIAFSLSRTALVVGALLFPVARFDPRRVSGWIRGGIWALLGIGLLYSAITYVQPLRARFFEGDVSMRVAGVPINAMGRTSMWEVTWSSYRESPWIGKGAGSSQAVVSAAVPGMTHPHNDYLRILHDYGAIGMVLWVLGYGGLMGLTGRAWLRADRARNAAAHGHLAAFLALLAVALGMVTDNVMIYVFVMGPLGVLVGMSLGQPPPDRQVFPALPGNRRVPAVPAREFA